MTDPELMQSLKAKAEQAKAAHAHKDESKRAFVEYHDAQREFVAAVNSPDAILRLLALVEQGPTIEPDDLTILRHIAEWRHSDNRPMSAIGLLVTIDQILRERLGLPHNAPLPAALQPPLDGSGDGA